MPAGKPAGIFLGACPAENDPTGGNPEEGLASYDGRMRMTVALALVAGVLVTLVLALGVMEPLELPARDRAMRALPEEPAKATCVIAIDEVSLRVRGPWPWPRATLAEIVDRCARSGARAIVLDILLSEPREGDEILALAMKRVPTFAVSVLVEDEQWLVPSAALRAATHIAHGNFELDHDGILRRFASTKQSGTHVYTALSLEAASLMRNTAAPIGRSVAPAFRTPPRSVPMFSAHDILADRIPAHELKGRIVFIGPTALGLGDRVLTPVSRGLVADPGVTVHAAATESLVRGERIHVAPPVAGGALAALIVGCLLPLRARARAVRYAGGATALALVLIGGPILLAGTGVAIPFASLLLVLTIAVVGVEASAMTASLRQSHVALTDQRANDLQSKRLLAHELKTPIASMRNLTQLLAGFELSEAERQRVAVLLQSEAGKLEGMVQALLDLERLSLRDFETSSSVVDLGDVVRGRMEVLCAGTDRLWEVSIAPDTLVRGDVMLLERVVDNLVGNALKYTPSPSAVRVTVRGDRGEALFEVADRGPGVAREDRERIFQRFYRGASAQGTEGLGLGLAFVAEVARWHGGRVTVDNLPEGGACFRFVLSRLSGGA